MTARGASQVTAVAISGPTCSGKTTLAQALAVMEPERVTVIPEPVTAATAIRVGRPEDWVAFESEIVNARISALAQAPSAKVAVVDRSADEDCSIFFQLHRAVGHIFENDLSGLRSHYLNRSIGGPEIRLYIYLHTARSTILKRLVQTSQPDWIQESIDRQLSLYEEWRTAIPSSRLIEIETDDSTPELILDRILSNEKFANLLSSLNDS